MEAQEYTWNSLNSAYRPGKGQHNPNRFFWMEDEA
jgi:hydroxymethylpyrimidine/phosphomethylpyrimidine kinase